MISALLIATIVTLAILFAITFASSLGLPGGDIWLVSSGALATDLPSVIIIIIVGFLGAFLGDLTAYLLTNKFSSHILHFLEKNAMFRNNEQTIKHNLKDSAFIIVFLSRFLFTGLGAVISYVSGIVRLDKRKFILAAVLGDFLYSAEFVLIGFFFKQVWTDLTNVINDIIVGLLILVILYFILRKYLPKWVRHQKK